MINIRDLTLEELEEERDIDDYDFECVAENIKNGITHGWLENGIEWQLEFNM